MDLYGKKPIVSVTYENTTISVKNSLPYLKCVLLLSCVVHGPIYGRFMGFYVNGFLSNLYTERKPVDLLNIFYRFVHSRVLGWGSFARIFINS